MSFSETQKQLNDQDNAITADPLFIVQQRNRVYGIDLEYAPEAAWFYTEDSEYEEATPLEARVLDASDEVPEFWEKIGYYDSWEYVQPFFTRKAAEKYIEANRHRLTDPRVFVESLYRNPEMQAIRSALLEGRFIEEAIA